MFLWNSLAFSVIQQMFAISDSSAFSKSSLNIWKFSVHVLLKHSLKDFERYFSSMWDEYNFVVVWTFFGIVYLWNWNETDLFQSCGHCRVFQIFWHIGCSTLTAIISAKAKLTLRWWPTGLQFKFLLLRISLTSQHRVVGPVAEVMRNIKNRNMK